MKLSPYLLALGLGALGAFSTLSCAAHNANIPVRSMPAGASFSGLWYTNFGDMKLTQQPDGSVRGNFDFKKGGSIEGKVEGGVMIFQWVQHGDFQVGRREVSGHAYVVISEDGLEFSGQWGYGKAHSGGGEWTGRKATEIYR